MKRAFHFKKYYENCGTKLNGTKGLKSDTIIQIIRQNDERPPAFKREWK